MALTLTVDQLAEVAAALSTEIEKGLRRDGARVQCLPTYIPPPQTGVQGRATVIELGGSNLRSAVVSIDRGAAVFVDGPLEGKMPWSRGSAFSKDHLIRIQARQLAALKDDPGGPLGYCFSFPAVSRPDRDARLLHWTKGLDVPGTVGTAVGRSLAVPAAEAAGRRYGRLSVLNDTVAALFAGLTEPGRQGKGSIGLILGTGTNMAAVFDTRAVTKLGPTPYAGKSIPVNLESGNFTPPHLTRWDAVVDRRSENRGCQRFEKAVSGLYLGRLFKAVHPDSAFDARSGARGLMHLLENPASVSAGQLATAAQILDRSAGLVAGALAGLIESLRRQQPLREIDILAEGRLFWSTTEAGIDYSRRVHTLLTALLTQMGMPDVAIRFPHCRRPTLVGTAVAALS